MQRGIFIGYCIKKEGHFTVKAIHEIQQLAQIVSAQRFNSLASSLPQLLLTPWLESHVIACSDGFLQSVQQAQALPKASLPIEELWLPEH